MYIRIIMENIYVGDSKNVANRINRKHCTGNVKVSALRRTIAERMGFSIIEEKIHPKYKKVYIEGPDRKLSEKKISDYLADGVWKSVRCDSKTEAEDFQYYVIEKLKPHLNKKSMSWDRTKESRYAVLLSSLVDSRWLDRKNKLIHDGFGVYIHGNEKLLP